MAPSKDADLLASMAAELQATAGEQQTTQAIIGKAHEVVPDAHHTSLTVHGRRSTYRTLGATSVLAATADQLQYVHREGPCMESADGVEWLRSGELTDDVRWRRWGPAAAHRGIHSVLSVGLLSRDGPFGALNMYSEEPGRFADRDVVELGMLYAVHAAAALSTARLVSGLETALSSRHQIGLAQGILMERYGLGPEQSFGMLRRISSALNRRLREVATEIVDTGSVPDLPHAAGSGQVEPDTVSGGAGPVR